VVLFLSISSLPPPPPVFFSFSGVASFVCVCVVLATSPPLFLASIYLCCVFLASGNHGSGSGHVAPSSSSLSPSTSHASSGPGVSAPGASIKGKVHISADEAQAYKFEIDSLLSVCQMPFLVDENFVTSSRRVYLALAYIYGRIYIIFRRLPCCSRR